MKQAAWMSIRPKMGDYRFSHSDTGYSALVGQIIKHKRRDGAKSKVSSSLRKE